MNDEGPWEAGGVMGDGKKRRKHNVDEVLKNIQKAIVYSSRQMDLLKKQRPFVVVVCGIFSTGKSSLINALLGCRLPTGTNPITKQVTRIWYGKEERAIILEGDRKQKAEISFREAEELIKGQGKEAERSEYEICYQVPSELLRQGVVFVDTPGFEDDAQGILDEMTRKEIRRADFCIVNFSCNSFGSKDERKFLKQLQDLTGGNFVMVLNCSNYLNGLDALQKLQDRADEILGNFGNMRIGYGKYFIVSTKAGQVYLDGFDQWLERVFREKAKEIQYHTLVSRTMGIVSKVMNEGAALRDKLSEKIAILENKEKEKRQKGKRDIMLGRHGRIQQLHRKYDEITKYFEMSLLNEIQAALSKLGAKNFNSRAFSEIEGVMSSLAEQIYEDVIENFPETESIYFSIAGITMEIIKATQISRERSYFDIDRYLVGAYEYYYNDYLADSMKCIREKTLPDFRKHMDQYFAETEEYLKQFLCFMVDNKEMPEKIERYKKYFNKLGDGLNDLEKNMLLLEKAAKSWE